MLQKLNSNVKRKPTVDCSSTSSANSAFLPKPEKVFPACGPKGTDKMSPRPPETKNSSHGNISNESNILKGSETEMLTVVIKTEQHDSFLPTPIYTEQTMEEPASKTVIQKF